jgi:hypothetical protein
MQLSPLWNIGPTHIIGYHAQRPDRVDGTASPSQIYCFFQLFWESPDSCVLVIELDSLTQERESEGFAEWSYGSNDDSNSAWCWSQFAGPTLCREKPRRHCLCRQSRSSGPLYSFSPFIFSTTIFEFHFSFFSFFSLAVVRVLFLLKLFLMVAGVGGVTLGVVCSSRPCWYISNSLVYFIYYFWRN